MGYSRKRTGGDGKPRYTAYYWDLKGAEKSAGTFSSKKEADKAWRDAEALVAQGRVGDPRRGRQTFERYVLETWLPNHEIEATTRQSYTYTIHRHLIPEFGAMRMIDILPEHVRAWVASMKKNGVSPATIKYAKVLLSAIFTTALNDQVTYLHPCRGVKTPTVPRKPRTIITPEQFDLLYRALPDADAQLLVETSIETGLRWSTALLLLAADRVIPRFDAAIFAHTGRESKEVMRHLDRMETIAVEAGIPTVRVSVPGTRPDALDPDRLPVSVAPSGLHSDGEQGVAQRPCACMYLIRPVGAVIRSLLGYPHPRRVPDGVYAEHAIGLSVDEVRRARAAEVAYIRNVFPLLAIGWTRADCQTYLAHRGLITPAPVGTPCIGAVGSPAASQQADHACELLDDLPEGREEGAQ